MPRAKKVSKSSVDVVEMSVSEEGFNAQSEEEQIETLEKAGVKVGPAMARVSIVLDYELPLDSFRNTSGDKREILMNRAKQHWMGEVGSFDIKRAIFEGI